MATFTDRTGREWTVGLTAGDLKRIRKDVGVDLREALKPKGGKFTEVLDDPTRFLDLMWALCVPPDRSYFRRVKALPFVRWFYRSTIDRDEFDGLFDRETTMGAVGAVWEAVWDFFRGRRAGAQARAMLLASNDQIETAVANALEKGTDAVRTGRTLSAGANASAESPESTTGDSPSAS